MAHTTLSPLPERLQYLEPVRKQLAALPPEAVLEDTDLGPLRKAVRKRIQGLSDTEILAALQQDTAELEQWLSANAPHHVQLHFLLPILPEAIGILFEETDTAPPERGTASMELPPDAKIVGRENGCWSVKWKKRLLVLYPQHHADLLRHTAQFHENAHRQPWKDDAGNIVQEVQFGPITGHKSVSSYTRGDLTFKSVSYTLTVPGGHLLVTIQSTGTKNGYFGETEIESLFPTLKVLNYSPPLQDTPPT